MSYFDDFKKDMESNSKVDVVDVVELNKLNKNFVQLIEVLDKKERDNKLAIERIEQQMQKLEYCITAMAAEDNGKELERIKELLHNCEIGIAGVDKGVRNLDFSEQAKKISIICKDNKMATEKLSGFLQSKKFVILAVAWGMFCTLAAIAQQIFNISGFSGIWSWVKVVTGLKVLLGMF